MSLTSSRRPGAARFASVRAALLAGLSLAALVPAAGAEQGWPQRAGGPRDDSTQAVASDKDGNIYVAGRFEGTATFGTTSLVSAGSTDVFVAKMDNVGNWLWATRGGGSKVDDARGVAVDNGGNVYVTGSFDGVATFGGVSITSTDVDVFAAKLDPSGQWLWARAATGAGTAVGQGIAVNEAGEAFVTGYFNRTIVFNTTHNTAYTHATDTDVFVAKLTDGGDWAWSVRAGGSIPLSSTDQAPANCLFHTSSDWRTGNCAPGTPDGSCPLSSQVWCCNAWGWCGAFWWFTLDENYCQNSAFGNREDAAQSLYGRPVCIPGQVTNAYSDDRGQAIRVVDVFANNVRTSHVYVAGYYQDNLALLQSPRAAAAKIKDMFVAKLTDGGSPSWRWVLDAADNTTGGRSTAGDVITASALAADGAGSLYVAGSYTGAPRLGTLTPFENAGTQTYLYAAKLRDNTTAATWTWGATAGRRNSTTYAGHVEATAIALDTRLLSDQGVYVAGAFRNDVYFNGNVGDVSPLFLRNLTYGTANRDAFVAKIGANGGSWQWAKRGGSIFDDSANGIVADAAGTTFVGGSFQGVGRFTEATGPFTFDSVAQGTYDVSETAYSVSLWVRTSCVNCGIFSVLDGPLGSNGHDRHLYLSGGNLRVRVWDTEVIATTGVNVADGNWHHIVHTLGSGGQRVYVDGVQRATGVKVSSNFTWQRDVAVGFSNDAGQPYLDGLVQNVSLYDRVLTGAEVVTLRDGFTPFDPEDEDLKASGGADAFVASLNPEAPGAWRSFEHWTVGEEVPRPAGVPAQQPEIEIGALNGQDYFFWSVFEKKLYAVRPTAALVKWRVSATNNADTRRVLTFGASDWPEVAQMHVAGAPVEVQLPSSLQPTGGPFTYAGIRYTTNGATDGNRVFQAAAEGWSVLLYANGTTADTTQFPAVLEVVRTVAWDSPILVDNAACTIGTPLFDPAHLDPTGKNGWVHFEKARYDGYGTDRAHDRANRAGPIVPVNESNGGDDMVVVWYRPSSRTGVPWASNPVRYNCQWPTTPFRIVIASEKGSDLPGQPILDDAVFVGKKVYNQPDANQPGFNPNDEHASFYPSNAGTGFEALFALRSDLITASDPYVILKYVDADSGEYRYLVYKVEATDAVYSGFAYPGTAGRRVFAPYPVRLLNACTETSGGGTPYWKDYKNDTWARSKGTVTVNYFYPLQLGFHYDINNNGVPDRPVGACVPWLDRRIGGTPGTPIPVVYNICWPDETCAVDKQPVPVLQAGETLTNAKRGLPEIKNQAAAEVVFDQTNPNLTDPTASLVQLIDPFSERTVPLDLLPGTIRFQNDAGRQIPEAGENNSRVPFHLRVRFFYDPLNRRLGFKGYFNDAGAGDALLLLNVMTNRERLVLRALSTDGAYRTALDALYHLTRNPRALRLDPNRNLAVAPQRNPVSAGADQSLLIGMQDADNNGLPEALRLLGVPGALSAGATTGTGYVTVGFNNHPSLNPLPVSLSVIKVDCGPYQGQIKVIESDNVFDEQLTLRHSGDFGGNADALEFEWYSRPDVDGTPPMPLPDPENSQLNGWQKFPAGTPAPNGAVDITIQGADIKTLSDNWFLVRYKGLPACSNTTQFSVWSGQPSLPTDPRAQLAEGWIKRVTNGLNPFETRVKDFHKSATNTYGSMLIQLGTRYEGDIALSPDPDNLNSIGLISAYETVFRRGKNLSVSGTPPVNYGPANKALLNIASRIADFYVLLGNEAYADAQDPTIGFSTKSGDYGTLAPTIFTFQNQLDSLLDEELTLLRGRDDAAGTVVAQPVYNRLYWNFTNGEGEIAYAQAYGVVDQDSDGVIDETDAQRMFPQGHGDAWGHFLTASKTYYDLLRHPFYTWENRAEAVLVAGTPIQVDYLDERKFARAAAAKAKAGAEIVNLTYRRHYVEDPSGQWQGYRDTNLSRAWGLDEWGRRAGQAAYLDWVVANSILPSVDENPNHTGIQRIDRTTVSELGDIASHYATIQAKVDEADLGLNPLGLAKGVVPFDIDPSLVSSGETHFEQIQERALQALNNAVIAFDHANSLSRMLRQNQDTLDDFRGNVDGQEQDYKNRLIEIFGYPYPDDIGPTGTYPTGYDGPDFYHYMYVDPSELTGNTAPPTRDITAYLKPIPNVGFHMGDVQNASSVATRPITYTASTNGFGLVKPSGWIGRRRAPGELQRALSAIYSERARYEQALKQYDNHLNSINEAIALLEAQHNVKTNQISILNRKKNTIVGLNVGIGIAKAAQLTLRRTAEVIRMFAEVGKEALPTVVGLASDATSGIRAAILGVGVGTAQALDVAADVAELAEGAMELSKEQVELQAEIDLEVNTQNFEIQQRVKELEQLLRQEPAIRLEAYLQKEVLQQAMGQYLTNLAQGERLIQELVSFRSQTAAEVQEYRYQDMAFRIFRNDALQKYRAQYDLAARYAYLSATAYDYETNLLGSTGAGRRFLTDVVKHRSLGQVIDGTPIAGSNGLADVLARLGQNFEVLKGQLGFNNPQTETNRFSLRAELFRQYEGTQGAADATDQAWRDNLARYRVANLWDVPEFRRYCRPFAPESAGPQPGLVIPFSTTVTFGLNFFGWPLGGGDSAYDPTNFATKVRSTGVWFGNYNGAGLSNTPRVYLVPVGADVLRSPDGDDFETREWRVVDQSLPVPFPLGNSALQDPGLIPLNDMSGDLFDIRRFSSFRAYHLSGVIDDSEMISDSRLIGRSVWNTRWLLIIPGGTLLFDPDEGLETFIYGQPVPGVPGERDGNGIDDIQVFFKTYAYSGN